MSQDDSPDMAPAGAAPKLAPEQVAQPRPVTRLNRRMLAVLVGGVATAVLDATIWSLQASQRRGASEPTELYNVDRVSRSEGLAQLPADYSQLPPALPPEVPMLGEPLPGDLGGPILRAEQRAQGCPPSGHDPAEAEHPARLKEAEEAAASSVFFRMRTQRATAATPAQAAAPAFVSNAAFDPLAAGPASTAAQSLDPTAVQNRQEQKEAFLSQAGSTQTRNPGNLQMPVSPYQVMAGTVIPAGLVTGIKSDLPGDVIATVTETVYDTATGRYPLIPQGSRLIGRYNSQVSYGQTRIQIVWHRIILPDTSSVQLDNLVGSDPAGYAGLEDGVDWHWDRIFADAALTTLLGIGAKLGRPREPPGRQPRHHRRPRQRAGHDEPDQPGGDAPQPEHPTYLDESARPADARHRQPRPGASAVPAAVLQQGSITMSTNKLRLGPLPSSISVKLTFTCPASLKADLDRYAALHAQTYGEAVDAATLIPHMLEAFMARDRGFKRTSIKT